MLLFIKSLQIVLTSSAFLPRNYSVHHHRYDIHLYNYFDFLAHHINLFRTQCSCKMDCQSRRLMGLRLGQPPRKINPETKIYDIDLFDSSKKLIKTLHSQDKIVICYFSAGTFEEWRPDAKNFTRAELGKPLNEWEGERWVNITSSNVFQIMQNRILLAKTRVRCN